MSFQCGWRFARITDDQSEALLGEVDVPITAPDLSALQWVHGWEAGLALMDRYPWAQLHAVYVHPEFVERERRLGAGVGSVRGMAAPDSSAPGGAGWLFRAVTRAARSQDFVRLAAVHD